MKRLLSILLLAFLSGNIAVKAQAPFTTMDSIDINNINAAILVHGDMWWNPVTELSHCYFPPDSQKNLTGAGAIWMSAYDGSGQLHVAAQTYRQTGNDYWPGPLDGNDTLTYLTSQSWAKIWKVADTDIQQFQASAIHTLANTPLDILTWPGNGNIYATGNNGIPLTINEDMAPFVDINGNGIYEPLLGEFPDIKGDEALWWIWSDNGPTHTQTSGKPLDVEVHAMAYGYNRGTLIDNVIYYEYTIVNRSPNNYTDFRIAQWDEVRLGSYYFDDFIGFDSIWRMGITYCGTNDNGAGGGHPPSGYALYPPKSAVTMIVLPGDTGINYVAAGSFNYYNNDASYVGIPHVDTQYNNYMRSKNTMGEHLTNDYKPRIPSTGYGPGPDCNYVFPGDPSDTTQWSECTSNNGPGDMMYVFSSNDFTLNAGNRQKVVFALLTTDRHDGGCPYASFDSIKTVADTAWADYYNPPAQAYVTSAPTNNPILIYPNPVLSELYIVNNYSTGEEYIAIYNTLGQKINLPISKNGTGDIIDVSSLPTAMYYIVYRKGSVQKTMKFLKE